MAFKCHLLPLAIALTIFYLSSSCALGIGGRLGQYEELRPIDQEAVANAKFAIEEVNKKGHLHLAFMRVVKAKRQVVSGINDELVIEARHIDGFSNVCVEATVHVPPTTKKPKQLLSVKPFLIPH